MIKVLIVDDSATVRQVVGGILDSASGIEVIGTAQDPIFAKKRMENNWPDVIILDIEMPRMDGITFLRNIMSERPTPVVMCSTLTENGSAISVKAMNLGAVEVIAKPKANLKDGLNEASRILINAVRAASQANMKLVRRGAAPPMPKIQPKLTADVILATGKPSTNGLVSNRIVAIGTSTGGTQALEVVLTRLPRNAPAIAVVQHMPEKFTRAFAERLNSVCDVTVKEAQNGDLLKSGHVLIAPGGRHMLIERSGSQLSVLIKDGPPVSRHRPSVDVLFRSVAKVVGKKSLGIIMTGMGNDGAVGLKEMHDLGAHTLAQNEATCVVYGMPGVAVKKGAVDEEIPLDSIADRIMAISSSSLSYSMFEKKQRGQC